MPIALSQVQSQVQPSRPRPGNLGGVLDDDPRNAEWLARQQAALGDERALQLLTERRLPGPYGAEFWDEVRRQAVESLRMRDGGPALPAVPVSLPPYRGGVYPGMGGARE